MKNEKRFKELLAQYCDVKPNDMREDMRFCEDLGLSSFDLMSLLGELEDNFGIEFTPENVGDVNTIGAALKLIGDERQIA